MKQAGVARNRKQQENGGNGHAAGDSPVSGKKKGGGSSLPEMREERTAGNGSNGNSAGGGRRVLITGGAGFIGSHLADELLRQGYAVRALDVLTPQTHGPEAERPDYLDPEVELRVGDVRDRETLRKALKGVDAVFHLAALVGVGQSMYEISKYVHANSYGSAVLMDELSRNPVERLVVASSMSIYGEGLYADALGQRHQHCRRALEDLRQRRWELSSAEGEPLRPIATPETKTPSLSSVYALSKYDQEQMALQVGSAYGFSAIGLRFFNVYGTRQALSNPYTGVLAIFAARYLNGRPPLINEDGRQMRDFVSVRDVARGCRLALEAPSGLVDVFNLGSGRPYRICDVAEEMGRALGKPDLTPEVTTKYRVGDIRHCFADIAKARRVLGYEPQVEFASGLEELAGWLDGRRAEDLVARAREELVARGLTL